MKPIIFVGSLATLVAVIVAMPSYALHEAKADHAEKNESVEAKLKETTSKVGSTVDGTVERVSSLTMSQSERIAQRKAELEQRLETKAAERKARLEGERLARCQNRQANINALIDRSVENGKRHLANIQRVEERVLQFAEKKSLDPTTYQSARDTSDIKEAEASAALSVVDDQNFTCDKADGDNPSDVIKTSNQTKRAALMAYRDSVISLIKVVKESFVATQSVDKSQPTGGTQ